MGPLEELHEAVRAAAATLAAGDGQVARTAKLERPPRAELGDYSTNAAMLLAPRLGQPPREVAERLAAVLAETLGAGLERTEVAGPGFLNLHLSDEWFAGALRGMLAAGARFGSSELPAPTAVNVEFVSANPTGPLHVGHARQAAFGDALVRIFEFRGYTVTREFYVNDYGSQVRKLGASVRALARGEAIPEDGYKGDYVATLVPREAALALDDEALERAALDACLLLIRSSLERFGVHFDVWFSERSLYDDGAVDAALSRLAAQGETYSADGALWMRTTTHGDDKDRVLVRSGGEHTYFSSDIAYLANKLERGFELMIYVTGADHHGYIGRMRAACEALGAERERVEMLILQLVHLIEDGARATMSKRAGEFVTLDELIERVGTDAARFFLLQRSHDTTVEIDIELAARASADNPVYYVQYAHARIASMLAKLGEERVAAARSEFAVLEPLHPSERALLKRLLSFPDDLAEAQERRAPHRVATAALEIAQQFTAVYRDCRVVGAEPRATESLRIAIALAARQTLATALALLGVSAPDAM
jgi:arginyl-tRNA synthetase